MMRRLPILGEAPAPAAARGAAGRLVVALVGAEYEENLSLRYLAAAVEAAGFAAVILPYNHADARGEVVDAVLAAGASVVGISVPFQVRAAEMLGLARALRARGYDGHITAGGHFATFEYERILADFPLDSIARHEGEMTLVELCARVGRGEPATGIAGLVVRESGDIVIGEKRTLSKLDSLPAPDRRGTPHDVLGVATTPMLGSRGCYADCSFCCIYAYAESADGARYRMRSPEAIVDEMRDEHQRRGVRIFVFHDDNFFLPYLPSNIKRYRRFAALLGEAGLTDIAMVIKCRPNDVDEELFALLQGAGVIRCYVGIETNSDEGIVSLNRRITEADNRRALAILDRLGIYHSYNVLLFDPEATLDGIERNLDFMEEFCDVPVNFCRAEVYAGTPLQSILAAEGRLRGDYLAWGYEMRDPRAELLFRIAATAFHARNFRFDGVANLNNGIRFDHEVLRRFYPGLTTPSLARRMVAFSRAFGEDNVARLRRALAFVRAADLRDRDGIKSFTLSLAREIGRADLRFLTEVKSMHREMTDAVRAAGGVGARRRFGDGMPPWSAESARLGTSMGREISTEILPAPSAAPAEGAR